MQESQTLCHESQGDTELRLRIVSFLATKHLPNLRKLNVSVAGGMVTLRGRVDSFHEKQVAIHSCRRVAGVRDLVDDVEVRVP